MEGDASRASKVASHARSVAAADALLSALLAVGHVQLQPVEAVVVGPQAVAQAVVPHPAALRQVDRAIASGSHAKKGFCGRWRRSWWLRSRDVECLRRRSRGVDRRRLLGEAAGHDEQQQH
eukprot:8522550-Alexandrium_andersonii.AAC.1